MQRRRRWLDDVFTEMAKQQSKFRPPPEDDNQFGLEHPLHDVQLAVFAAENWHVLPFAGGLFDQPLSILNDMLRYINKRDEIASDNSGQSQNVPPYETYQEIESEIPTLKL